MRKNFLLLTMERAEWMLYTCISITSQKDCIVGNPKSCTFCDSPEKES
jgi:hypothetical protein